MAEPQKIEADWIITFADLVTLLFCFFVLLTVLSNQPKRCSELQAYLEANSQFFQGFELRSNKSECIVSLPSDFLFSSGSAKLQQNAFGKITPLFEKIMALPDHKDDLLIIEGHTDNTTIKSREFPSNWELSTSRATNVSNFVIKNIDFPEALVSVRAYADKRPRIAYENANGTPLAGEALRIARQKNRRVEIVLTKQPKDLNQFEPLFDGR